MSEMRKSRFRVCTQIKKYRFRFKDCLGTETIQTETGLEFKPGSGLRTEIKIWVRVKECLGTETDQTETCIEMKPISIGSGKFALK